VGATSLTASQPNGGYESETAWNDGYGASNGGYSTVFPRPGYQAGFVHGSGAACRTSSTSSVRCE